jgi:UDP-3-O-[3-hydroxymyristoyl] N-acetylglucosamine deacetylase
VLSGHGLHTGVFSEVRLHRVEGGVRFLRNGTEIPALLESVIATPRCTILGKDNEKIALVEHLLAALHVLGWWEGVLLEVSGEEIPILDGSAQGWVEEVRSLGTPPPLRSHLEVVKGFGVQGSGFSQNPKPLSGSKSASTIQAETDRIWNLKTPNPEPFLSIEPGATKLSVSVNYDHPAIGSQTWEGSPEKYPELLSARTFGFLKEYETLRSQGLASHVSLENAIVFHENGTLSPLRFSNEPVRHKALDVLGDFFLLGKPLLGSLSVARGSHHAHVTFMRQLLAHDILQEVEPYE